MEGFLFLQPVSILLYNIGIRLYCLAIRFAAKFNGKARLFVSGRKHLLRRLKNSYHNQGKAVAWFHCASLGEFEQARPLIEEFKKNFPDYHILLTFFSPSGYEIRKNYELADEVFYLPLDIKYAAQGFIDIIQPKVGFIIKYEFWFNLLQYASKKEIPLLSVSSIIREDHVFTKWYGGFFRRVLTFFNHFFVQDHRSGEILKGLGIRKLTIAGDTRFDRVKDVKKNKKQISLAHTFSMNKKTFIIGSCWPQDMEVLLPFINESQHYRFIIAPHEISDKFISRLEHDIDKKNCIRYSEAAVDTISKYDVLIIDNVGLLSSLYQYGTYAYVGGAFGQGLHNILEAATFGIPIFFGNKNYKKFREAVELSNLGGAFPVDNYSTFHHLIKKIESDPEQYQMACEITANYVTNNIGATGVIIDYCKKLNL